MLFNSLIFLLFFLVFFVVYWLLSKRLFFRNVFILISSYIFYGWWDWRFLGLIFLSTVVDFLIGNLLYKQSSQIKKKVYLALSLFANIGLLAYFKYVNFFIESFQRLFDLIGLNTEYNSLQIILPVGISFYTFQTLSYTIDIYRGKIKPVSNFIQFASFVSFFPQLVAGPIERAKNLLPQFNQIKRFNYSQAKIGLSQIIWGYFKKIVIADNCAVLVDQIFSNQADVSSWYLIAGAVLFAFQIYCDFSGYSDIAIGISRLIGFELMTNFRYPYFSRDIAEFWRRWHISLSTWFRDYLYIPLGGSKVSFTRVVANIFIIFVVSGFWHGANWTFIFWGFLNAIYFIPLFIFKINRSNLDTYGRGTLFKLFRDTGLILTTFALTCIAWIFFRAQSLEHAFGYIIGIFNQFDINNNLIDIPFYLWFMIAYLIVVDFFNRQSDYVYFNKDLLQKSFLVVTGILIVVFGYFEQEKSFIYFQF